MPARYAILIGNAVAYSLTQYNVPQTVVRQTLRDFAHRLENLAENSFDTTIILNKKSSEAEDAIRTALRPIRDKCELLLFYYFGHATLEPEQRRLYFITKSAAEHTDYPGMVAFDTVLRYMVQYRIPRVAIILDCCYAGIVMESVRSLTLDSFSPQYCVLAAVTHEGQAVVDYEGELPLGLFTSQVLRAFDEDGACTPGRHDVTWRSLFDFVRQKTVGKGGSNPDFIDGGLADEIFLRQSGDLYIPAALRQAVPKKSLYSKIHSILSIILTGRVSTPTALYRLIERRNPKEFQTPFKEAGRIEYRCVSRFAVDRYLGICRTLGLIDGLERIGLTKTGKEAVRRDGVRFNAILHRSIFEVWEGYGITHQLLEDVIVKRLSRSAVPLLDGIYADLYIASGLRMSRELFRALLDLSAHCGALSHVREPTYFLATSFKEAIERTSP